MKHFRKKCDHLKLSHLLQCSNYYPFCHVTFRLWFGIEVFYDIVTVKYKGDVIMTKHEGPFTTVQTGSTTQIEDGVFSGDAYDPTTGESPRDCKRLIKGIGGAALIASLVLAGGCAAKTPDKTNISAEIGCTHEGIPGIISYENTPNGDMLTIGCLQWQGSVSAAVDNPETDAHLMGVPSSDTVDPKTEEYSAPFPSDTLPPDTIVSGPNGEELRTRALTFWVDGVQIASNGEAIPLSSEASAGYPVAGDGISNTVKIALPPEADLSEKTVKAISALDKTGDGNYIIGNLSAYRQNFGQ